MSTITDQAVVLNVVKRGLTVLRPLAAGHPTVSVEQQAAWPEAKAIEFLDKKRIEPFVVEVALPATTIKRGLWLLPLALLRDFEQTMGGFVQERERLVQLFAERTPQRLQAAGFTPGAYAVAPEQVVARWLFRWQYMEVGVPAALPVELRQRETVKMGALWQEVADRARSDLRRTFVTEVQELCELLGPAPVGVRRVIKDARLASLTGFLRTFEARNLTGDRKLAALVDRVQTLLRAVDGSMLRQDELVREAVRDGLARLDLAALDGSLSEAAA